ncbi:colicin transporter [Bifidobacterium dentium]|uniref:colicin transporter n=1 Tax=Bifidobacterium dentium TaxID=1689 RepID=UPI003D186B63
MTEKEKTIELSTEPTEKKKPHRRRAVVITVVALALLAAGGIAWKTHTDRLMAEARADCAAASERLRIVTNDYNTLLDDQAASMAKPDRKSVKDAKTLDVLSKAMKASTPKTVSCKADSRPGVQDATKAITANASWYKAHTKSLNRLVKAVETSKLDKTVDDADALYKETDGKETDGKVADGKTRASLLDAIKKRDAAAIAKAMKEVNESKAAKEQADAEAKARAEQEAAAAAAAAQQAQASQSQTYSGGGSYSNRGYSHSGASSSGSGGSASSPSQSNGGGSSAGSGSDLHIVIGGSGTPAQNGPSHGEPNF